MKLTINYKPGTTDYPVEASIELPNGTFAVASGKTHQDARSRVIERARFKLQYVPQPEEVEI